MSDGRSLVAPRPFLRSLFFSFVSALALAAPPLAAQTTGTISGLLKDAQGSPLPGVVVEAKGPTLQGVRTSVTEATGRYRLTLLPPGTYTVSTSLSGFAPETRAGISVGLNAETTLDIQMHLSAAADILVIADAAAVDTTTSSLGTNLDERAITSLPTGRNYTSVTQVAPGVSSDANPENTSQSTISIYGSTGAENVFYIDGVNTTGAEYGFQGKELNFEFIQAVEVKTGGYEAEYGRSTGGIVNVITKSGGDEWHIDAFGYYDSDGLQANAKDVVSNERNAGYKRKDFGLGLGGFFVKEKLWFFGAYDRVENEQDSQLPDGPRAGQIATSQSDRDLAAAKLTFNFGTGNSIVASFFQDPRDDTGAINDAQHSLNGDELTYLGLREFGGHDFALRYEGLLGTSWLASAQASRHEETNSVGPATGAGDVIQTRTVDENFFARGGFGLLQAKEFVRNSFGFSVTHFARTHELKFGFEYEAEKADVVRRFSGGQQVDIFSNAVTPSRPIYSHYYWTTPTATVANAPVSALTAAPKHRVTTLYLQDKFTPLPNLTISAGLRWDRQEIIDAAGTKQIDLKKDIAPRLGFSWDPSNDRKTKVYGSYGQYYEQLSMDLVIRSFSFERQARIFNFSPTATTPDAAAEAAIDRSSAIFGGFTEPVDPNLRNQYIHEGILGAERELVPGIAFGIKGIYRTYGEVIEDFLCADDGTYCIGNPGKGLMERIYTLDYSQTYAAPKAERKYTGIQLDVTKRFSKNWQGQASYIWSRLKGNFDGLYAPFTNVGADPNISAAFDYYDFFTDGRNLSRVTNQGMLSNDRRHQLKLSGYYVFPFNLTVGMQANIRGGTPLTRYGYSDAYGRYEFFLTERGAEGRAPTTYDADLNLSYPIKLGPVTVNALVTVFNLFNTQKALLLDQRYGFQEADNAGATPANPGYLQPVLRTPPTSVRLGLRVSY
ncbi:MAG: TonB-dependent receptor [Acidobacteria bacterium]|nr:TonB-dependent receptor [Acidobacteriota bacterium]